MERERTIPVLLGCCLVSLVRRSADLSWPPLSPTAGHSRLFESSEGKLIALSVSASVMVRPVTGRMSTQRCRSLHRGSSSPPSPPPVYKKRAANYAASHDYREGPAEKLRRDNRASSSMTLEAGTSVFDLRNMDRETPDYKFQCSTGLFVLAI